MGKKSTNKWTADLTDALLRIKKRALAMKCDGDMRALMKIIHIEWKKIFPSSMVTMMGLKIKLSKLDKEGRKKESPKVPSSPKEDRNDKAKDVKQDKVSNSQSKTLSPNVSISDASCSEDEGINDNMSCSTNDTDLSLASKRLSVNYHRK